MDVLQRLTEKGFCRVIALNGADCGQEVATVLLALWQYEAQEEPNAGEAWIHPYYFASQQAYLAASSLVREAREEGIPLTLRDDIRIKPIFARLPGFSQGRNTLSYTEKVGSRFHVQIFTLDMPIPSAEQLLDSPHGLHCGECRLCIEACPTNALDDQGYHRERCLRQWMMPSGSVPDDIRSAMGNRLIGCDACQRCCPHNLPPKKPSSSSVPLATILRDAKAASAALAPLIGANLAIPNRLLSQACMMAGSTLRRELLPELEQLTHHPSPAVREHAAWAVRYIGAQSAQDDV